MRSDWLFPICTGGERLKDEDDEKVHPTQKPEALLLPHPQRDDASRATWCSTRSSAPARPARWRKKLGRHFIGIEREDDLCRGGAEADRRGQAAQRRGASRPTVAKRAAPRVPSARWSKWA